MSGATPAPWAPADAGHQWLFTTLLVVGSVATAAAAIAGNGSLITAVAPVLAAGLLAAVWVMPMRITLLGLIFLGLALDVKGEGPWESPVAPLGLLLSENLNKTIPVQALTFPLTALVLGYVLVIHVHRLLSGSRVDGMSQARIARPLLWAMSSSLLAVIVLIALGATTGGDIKMAKLQVQSFALVLLMAYLLTVSLRDLRDYRILGGLILVAAVIKAVMASWVWYTIQPPPASAISHGDSLLFACAAMILIARFAEHPVSRNAWPALLILPPIAIGMIANNRRIAWVEVAAAAVTLYVISPQTWLKRCITRRTLLAMPLVLAYIAVGWNSQSSVFAPVKLFRTVEDADADPDRSTLFRDLENYNLVATLRAHPFLGSGFGHPYNERVPLDDISFFKEYHFLPHNSVLGLWGFCGVFGFTAISMPLVVGVFLAARSYRCARQTDERVAAFMSLAMLVIYAVHAWGDIGFAEKKTIFVAGVALAVAGNLAVSTGAWGSRRAAIMTGQR